MLFFAGLGGALALLFMPQLLPPYYLIVLTSALAFAIGCLGLNLLLGNTEIGRASCRERV